MAKIRKINTHSTEESLSFETLFKEALEVDLFHYYSRQREHFKKSSKLAQQTHWNSIFSAYLEENFPGTTIDQYKTLYTRTNFKKCVDERTSIEVKAEAEKTKTLINNWYKPPETTFYSPMQVADMLVKVGHGPIQLIDGEEVPVKIRGKRKEIEISTPTLKSFISEDLTEKQKEVFYKFIKTEYTKVPPREIALLFKCSIELKYLDSTKINANVSATHRALQTELNIPFTLKGYTTAIAKESQRGYKYKIDKRIELSKTIQNLINSNK